MTRSLTEAVAAGGKRWAAIVATGARALRPPYQKCLMGRTARVEEASGRNSRHRSGLKMLRRLRRRNRELIPLSKWISTPLRKCLSSKTHSWPWKSVKTSLRSWLTLRDALDCDHRVKKNQRRVPAFQTKAIRKEVLKSKRVWNKVWNRFNLNTKIRSRRCRRWNKSNWSFKHRIC